MKQLLVLFGGLLIGTLPVVCFAGGVPARASQPTVWAAPTTPPVPATPVEAPVPQVSETAQPAPVAASAQTQSKVQARRAAAKARRQALRAELAIALETYREQRIAQKADKGNPPRTKPERQPAKPALIGGIVAVVLGGLFLVAVFTFLPPLTALISIATLTLGIIGILTGIILILLAIFNVL